MLFGNGTKNLVLQENGQVQVHPGRKFRNAEELRLSTQFVSSFTKQTKYVLYQCFSKCGPCTKIISITGNLVRNTNSQLKCRHTESEPQLWHLPICVYKVLPVIWMHVWVRPELPNSWIFFSFLNYHLLFFSIHSSKVCTMAHTKKKVMEKDWEIFFNCHFSQVLIQVE